MTAWSFVCPDWREKIKAGRSLIPSLPLDQARVKKAIDAFNKLRLPDVEGLPFLAEAAGDWFREIVAALHGSIDPLTGLRHVRELFVLVPKKNSKTSNGAALMFGSLLINKRPQAEFLLIAPTQPISEIAFKQVEGMVAADPYFRSLIHVQPYIKKITNRKTNSTLQVKSFDPNVLTGVKPAGVLLDELHVVSTNPNADRVVGQLRGGLISQPEGFLVFITTQSERPPAGVFKAELSKARRIRDGEIAGSMLPVLYEFPEDIAADDGWRDTSNWWMVTPNLGRSIHLGRLIEDYQTAVDTSEEELRRWASQHLNIEIGLALRADRWPGAEFWEKQGDEALDLDHIVKRSDVIAVGIDGGGLDDLLGLAVLGRDAATQEWLVWCHAYAHHSVLERRKSEAPKLLDFQTCGDLTIVEAMEDAFEHIAAIASELNEAGVLGTIGLDPHGVSGIVEALALRGIEGSERVVGVSQGYKLTGTIKSAEVKLADGSLIHCGQPLMAWCASNAKIEPKGNAIIITKQASGTAKIDPLMALFNAVALMGLNPQPVSPKSVYEIENRGLFII
jgi:phage terminase large subunit-like protein